MPLSGSFGGRAADFAGMSVQVNVTTEPERRRAPARRDLPRTAPEPPAGAGVVRMLLLPGAGSQRGTVLRDADTCRIRAHLRVPAAHADAARAQHPSLAPDRPPDRPGAALHPAGRGARLHRRLRQRLHPHRGAGRPHDHRDRVRDLRQRPARRRWRRTPASTTSASCPTRCSSTSSAAATATPTGSATSPGRSSATPRPAGRGCRRSATSCTTTSASTTRTPIRCAPPTAASTDRTGVCRDFAHLAITLCRCMNIPARYCTGYLGDIGVPPVRLSHGFQRLVRGLARRPLVHLRRPPQHPAHRPHPHGHAAATRPTWRSPPASAPHASWASTSSPTRFPTRPRPLQLNGGAAGVRQPCQADMPPASRVAVFARGPRARKLAPRPGASSATASRGS